MERSKLHSSANETLLSKKELMIGGLSASWLAEKYGTPLIVYDEEKIRNQIHDYKQAFHEVQADFRLAYACKAFCSTYMCQIAQEEGLWLDVVSGGELFTALKSGFQSNHILMHGNNKTKEELEFAVTSQIGLIVVDNFHEIEVLGEILNRTGQSIDIMIRVSPGVDVHTHDFISTGQQDSKFGFDLYSGQVEEAIIAIKKYHRMRLMGIHAHIGSQIFDAEGFGVAAKRMADLSKKIERELDVMTHILNLGGGLGIRYTSEDTPMPLETLVEEVVLAARKAYESDGLSLPLIMLEPGRSIVAEAGTTIYRVGSRKEIPGLRTYVAVDGGMTDNPRLALYGAKYEAVIANKMNANKEDLVSIAGKACESGDMLIWDIELPKAEPGDLLAVFCTGAYNYSMASNYNRIPRPAVVFVREGQSKLVLRRETYDDLLQLEMNTDFSSFS